MPNSPKEGLAEISASLPENASWDEVMYRLNVRQKIESGMADVRSGRVVDVETLFAEFETDEAKN